MYTMKCCHENNTLSPRPSPLFGWEGEGLSNSGSQTLKFRVHVMFNGFPTALTTVWMGGRGALKLSNSGFLSESLPQDRMSDGNPGWVQSLACVCYILKLKFSTHVSGGELCATAAGVDCGTIRKVPQNPGTSEY